MSSTSAPYPLVIDPTFPSPATLPYKTVVILDSDIGIVLSRADASKLAIALHEFDRSGATLAGALRLLRDELDKTLTSRAAPPIEGSALLTARKERRRLLWKMLADEERAIAGAAERKADLSPTRGHATQPANLEAMNREYSTAGYVNQEVIDGLREDWQC